MKLPLINNLLLAAVIGVNLYSIMLPLLPSVTYWHQNKTGQVKERLQTKIDKPTAAQPGQPARPNSLIVPSMMLDQPVYEGPSHKKYTILDKGLWRWPAGSTPDKGGNTVVLGHRFTYSNPNGVLYHLDKVKIGDTIGYVWDNITYRFTVQEVNTVPPTDIKILDATNTPTLTVYTCTPLWKPSNRLVIVATATNINPVDQL